MGVRSSCEASATNLTQVLLVLPQARLGGDTGREGRLNSLEHHVEGAGQSSHLCGLVGAGNALVEVAGRDGVSRALNVFERAQPESDQPPSTGQGEDQRARRDGQLGEEERVQRAGLVHERLRVHQHGAVLRLDRSHTEGRAARSGGTSGEIGHIGPVGLGGEARDRVRKLRPVGGLPDVGGTHEAVEDSAALLDHGAVVDAEDIRAAFTAARESTVATGASSVVDRTETAESAAALWRVAHHVAAGHTDRRARAVLGQLLVDLVVQGSTQRRVGGEVRHDQRDDGDRSDREEESEPE